MHNYTQGQHSNEESFRDYVLSASLGNLKGAEDIQLHYNVNLLFNVGYTVFFLAALPVCLYLGVLRISQVKSCKSGITEHSVQVTGLPRVNISKQEIIELFQRYRVAEVYFAGEYRDLLKECRIILKTERELRRAAVSDDFDRLSSKLMGKYGALMNKLRRSEEYMCSDDLNAVAAFVVFETIAEKMECLRCYEKGDIQFKYQEIHSLKLESAPEPSTILYKNLEVSQRKRCCISFFVWLLYIILVLFQVILMYTGLKNLDNIPENYQIPSLIVGIVLINILLNYTIRGLTSLEMYRNYNKEQTVLMIRLLISMLINTAAVISLLNIDIKGLYDYEHIEIDLEYTDFTAEWYYEIGTLYVIVGIALVFSSHLFTLLIFWPLFSLKKQCCKRRYKTQFDLNLAYLGGEFDIAARSAQPLLVIMTLFSLSGGLPILNILCLLSLTLIYLSERLLVLHYYKSPPYLTPAYFKTSLNSLYFSIILHSVLSFYMHSSTDIFPKINDSDDLLYEKLLGTTCGLWFSSIILSSVLLVSSCHYLKHSFSNSTKPVYLIQMCPSENSQRPNPTISPLPLNTPH